MARSITEDFKKGLTLAIELKLGTDQGKVAAIMESILTWIREKNSSVIKSEVKTTVIEQFVTDLNEANYLAIITSRPLEIDEPGKSPTPSLRKFLFTDLIGRLYDKEKDIKFYRFNFPTENFGLLFWRGLRRILLRQFTREPSRELFESLYQKFLIKLDTWENISKLDKFSPELIEEITEEILTHLNSRRYILVFTTTAPIYGLPMIIMNPTDSKNTKVYALLEADSEKMSIFRFPEQETLLWRLFVWDSLKSKRFAGQELNYSIDKV